MGNKNIRFVAEVGVYSAVGLVLDFLSSLYSGFIWPMGGSFSFAMVPIFIMAFKYGLKGGITTGFIIGTIQILWGGSGVTHPLQVILDYSLAYSLVGFAGLFKKNITESVDKGKLYYITIASIIGGLLRLVSHIVSGEVFFSAYTPEGLPTLAWSVIYNMGFMIPSIIISLIVVIVLVKRFPEQFLETNK